MIVPTKVAVVTIGLLARCTWLPLGIKSSRSLLGYRWNALLAHWRDWDRYDICGRSIEWIFRYYQSAVNILGYCE